MNASKGGNAEPRYSAPLTALATLVGFGGAGWFLIDVVQGRSLLDLVGGPRPLLFQLSVGVAYGLAFGLAVRHLARRPFMSEVAARFAGIGRWIARPSDIALLSACAGVGEEIMARGAVQHWLGVVATAIVFVAVHGYIDPRSWRVSLLGLAAVAGNVPLGLMADHWGLAAPMAAHATFDAVVLLELARAAAGGGGLARPPT